METLELKTEAELETGCCPKFRPERWDEQKVFFTDKLFLKEHVTCLFHIPLNFGKVMLQSMIRIEEANAEAEEQLVLTDEKSPWGADIYIAIDKEVPGTRMERMTGHFLSKVFVGPYKDAGKFAEEMKEYVKSKGEEVKKLYFYYAYCPKCAKAYGKNYITILAKI